MAWFEKMSLKHGGKKLDEAGSKICILETNYVLYTMCIPAAAAAAAASAAASSSAAAPSSPAASAAAATSTSCQATDARTIMAPTSPTMHTSYLQVLRSCTCRTCRQALVGRDQTQVNAPLVVERRVGKDAAMDETNTNIEVRCRSPPPQAEVFVLHVVRCVSCMVRSIHASMHMDIHGAGVALWFRDR